MSLGVDDVRYARSGSANIAYHVRGSGNIDILLTSWAISIEDLVGQPKTRDFVDRLASFSRVILYDRRGVGLSDPFSDTDPPTLEQQKQDALAILDEVRAQQACVVGDVASTAGALLAAEHPERVTHLVCDHPAARILAAPDFPSGVPAHLLEHELDSAEEELRSGRPLSFIRALPSVVNDPQALSWWIPMIRRAVSPGTMRTFLRVLLETDIRSVLPSIHAPVLVICRRDAEPRWVQSAEHFAGLLPNATIVRPPGADPLMWVGDIEPIADAIRDFTGSRMNFDPTHRTLTTVLFTDIVDSTKQAAAYGDKRWRELLDRHDALVDEQLGRHGGKRIKDMGDGILATFDGPARGVRCACAISDAVAEIGIEIRSGLHTGEIERRGDDVSGIAVVIARRVCDTGGARDVLVSRTVTDLVAGSGLEFEDRGEHDLKGVPERWRLYWVRSG
jgi:class 3 adenylate cyclase